jgi:retron-type reverse transcriptase
MMPPLFSLENLYRQYLSCRRQKRNTHNALRFEVKLEDNLVRLREELEGRTYHPSRSVCFVVKQPKFREIFAADFRDRVVHHVLVAVLERVWEPIFLHDSYACRKDKGTHRAVKRLQQFMRRVTHNGTKPGYALQLDIRGFFFHIDKEVLFQIIAKRMRDETLLWLARTIIFHDCTEQALFKTDRKLWRHIPPHKTLFGTENRRGLPIGNLTSQFFSNVYLNELDQFVKHRLKARQYLRYSDDFVLVHEDPAQLLVWREQIETFLAERLRLSLTDPSATPRLISNGVDFLGYIVRPDYLLVRRRVVSRLKTRLRDYERTLVRPQSGHMLFRHDPVTLARLRATWASYRAHLTMANSHRLWDTLVNRCGWVRHYFALEAGLLVPRAAVPPTFACLKAQYQFFVNQRPEAILLFRVGCFYEWYDKQAAQASRLFGLRLLAPGRGFRYRCGLPVRHGSWCIQVLVTRGVPVALIRETEDHAWPGGVKPRVLAAFWQPVAGEALGRNGQWRTP